MTYMNANNIRARNDLELSRKLLSEPFVQKVVEQLERAQEEGSGGTRRHLLATSVRLSKSMAPGLHDHANACAEKLGLELPLEIYVYSSPTFNAACVKPEDGRLFVMFSSSLLEAFKESELRFVMGHEIGHHVYGHHDIPIGYILRGEHKPPPALALQLFAWSRYAEISADRAGAHCAEDLEGVARSLFRLASGLTGDAVEFQLDEFLSQVDAMQTEDAEPGQGAPMEDWFSTHPFSPLRVKALKLYHDSVLARGGKNSADSLEASVQTLMSLMEPSYLQSKTPVAESMRRLLFAGAIAVADSTGGIGEKESEVFEQFFGDGALSEKLDLEKVKAELPDRIENTRSEASHGQCTQVIRDLCVVARADGRASGAERKVIEVIARDLGLSASFVNGQLEADRELD
jgi:tellurite resistance protein